MILSDRQISDRCRYHNDTDKNMIFPFLGGQIRSRESALNSHKVISYGLSSYGYDIRLSKKEFLVFVRKPLTIIDPKNFDTQMLESAPLIEDYTGSYFILPAHTYALGVAVERLNVPDNILVICLGKSTYARSGLIVNVTPAEPGWRGHLTLEISNSSCADAKVYADEGIAQLVFHEGTECKTTYSARDGKYQDQSNTVVLPKA